MHEKFMCYCTTNTQTLADSIAALEQKIPQIEASIKETEAAGGGVAAELEQHKKDHADAKESIESATAQREKEAAEFAKTSGDLKANIAACGKAITAISKGMGAAFLQSGSASALKKIVLTNQKLDRYSREALTEFLSADTSSGYAPASGEIVGILKQLLEDMEGDLKEAIESKTERKGQVAVEIVNLKNDLEDAQEALGEDQKFLAELKKSCATAEAEYEDRKAMRAQEMVAIGETIKILND